MMMNDNWTYSSDGFGIDTNIESLCCTPEINVMLCYIYLNLKNIAFIHGKSKYERNQKPQMKIISF